MLTVSPGSLSLEKYKDFEWAYYLVKADLACAFKSCIKQTSLVSTQVLQILGEELLDCTMLIEIKLWLLFWMCHRRQ